MNSSQIIFYSTPQRNIKVEVVFENETFWLTQKAMTLLLGVEIPAISKHLKNIFETGELEKNSVVSILERTAADGEFEKYRFIQDRIYESDFDREIKKITKGKK